jgi:hypothetical protein
VTIRPAAEAHEVGQPVKVCYLCARPTGNGIFVPAIAGRAKINAIRSPGADLHIGGDRYGQGSVQRAGQRPGRQGTGR